MEVNGLGPSFPDRPSCRISKQRKTTFIERILEKAFEQELNLGRLKHHGHGGEPQTFTEGKTLTVIERQVLV